MEVQTNKRMQMYLFLIKAIFVVILICNFTLSVYGDAYFHPTIFGVLDCVFWFYGVLCAGGRFRKAVTDPDNEGIIEYEIRIPYAQVMIMRVLQLSYSLIAADNTNYAILAILTMLDFVYTVFLLVYKASYYYVSIPVSEDEED